MIFTSSWDDGNSADLKLVKILKEFGIKGTFYIPINWKYKNLSENEIKKISKFFEIGCHSFSHNNLTQLDSKDVEIEVNKSKVILEEIVNNRIKCFSYPFGKLNTLVINTVKKSGFTYGRTSNAYDFEFPENLFKSNITISVSNRTLRFLNPRFSLIALKNHLKWDKIAKKILMNKKKPKIFHLFGHSWEIEKENNWESLINFLDYLLKIEDVEFMTNGEFAHCWSRL